MTVEGIVTLLEKNWDTLQVELDTEWADFTATYEQIIARLPDPPTDDALEDTADELAELLDRYEYGRQLLRGYSHFGDEKILPAAGEVLKDAEPLQQIRNRMVKLRRKTPEVQKPKATKRKVQAPKEK